MKKTVILCSLALAGVFASCGTQTKTDAAPMDYTQYVNPFIGAADNGHTKAQFNLANKYLKGQGVPKDPSQAVLWFHRAAEGGDVFFTENGTLGLFFCGQLPLLCQLCQLVDPVDFFLIHN